MYTAGENVNEGDAIFVNPENGKLYKCKTQCCRTCYYFDNGMCKILWDGDEDNRKWLAHKAIVLDYVRCDRYKQQEVI